jgi:hypothetical protein
MLAKQALYHLSHSSSSGYFAGFFALVILEMGSLELFAWTGLELRASHLSFTSSQDYRCEPVASGLFCFPRK